jgi:putative heme-binding domain-containing protein
LRQICETLVRERLINVVAAKGLSLFDDPRIGEQLVKAYRGFRAPERPQIISLLVSRPAFAKPLMQAIAAGKIPREDLTSYHVRQIHSLGDPELSRMVTDIWGQLRDTPADKRKLITDLKSSLTDDILAGADMSRGRLTFSTICAKCHRLYGEGASIGPDLTGSNRSNLDYLLENVIDPSAVVNKDFRMTVLVMADGRVLNGVITSQTDRTLTLQSLTEKLTLDKEEIDAKKPTTLSPMPEGLLTPLTDEQVRDLFAYLRHPSQVALPPSAAQTSAARP